MAARLGEFILGIWLCLGCLPGQGQEAAAPADFNLRLWQAEDGLPNNIVQAVAQTTDGYLWIGTREGVARFDGEQFNLLNIMPQGAQPSILCLLGSRDGSLWIGTENSGIYCLRSGQLASCTPADGNSHFSVYQICQNADGEMWFETSRGVLVGKSGKLERPPGLGTAHKSICADQAGRIWVLDGNLRRADAAVPTNILAQSGLLPHSARSLYCDQKGIFWIGTDLVSSKSLIEVENQTITNFRSGKGPTGFASAVLRDSAGELWIGTYAGLGRLIDGKFVEYDSPDESAYRIYAIFEDREKNLWVGSEAGLARLTPKRFKTITRKEGLSLNTVVSVCPSRDGSVWIGTWGGGLDHYVNGRITVLSKTNGLRSDFIMGLAETRDGSLWAGMDYGGPLHRIQDGRVTVYDRAEGFAPGSATTALYEDEQGVLWIGNREELQCWNGADFVKTATQNRLNHHIIDALCGGGPGTVWIGTSGGLMRWQNGRFENLAATNQSLRGIILSLYLDADKNLWIGTKGRGLWRFRDGVVTEFTTAQGLFSDSIYSILEDGRSNLWLNSSRGIFRLSKAELAAVAEGKAATVTSIGYGKADGILASGQYRDVTQPSACKDASGRLWFRTTQGVTMVDPETVTINDQPPPVVIQQIIADNQPMIDGEMGRDRFDPLTIPPGRGDLEIQYAALSYRAPEKNLYRYKLEGADTDWVEAGTRRVTKYSNLPPGHYRFRVIACNNDGIWNETGSSVELSLEPHFWDTTWFFFLLAVTSVALVGGVARYITRRRMQRQLTRLEKQHAIAQERTRIARDVHDELGAKLTRISFQGSIAKCSLNDPVETERQIEQMSLAARDAASSLHEIVWAADPVNDSLEGLVSHISHHAEEFFSVGPVSYEVVVPAPIPPRHLSAGVRHNLFLAVKEATNNAAKHARATHVLIQIAIHGAELEISVLDNGVGFEPRPPEDSGSPRSKRPGYGLVSMHERLSGIHGRCEINSGPGQGTMIRFTVPLGAGES